MASEINLYQYGADAMQQKRYTQAVQALEAFCRASGSSPREFFQAQMWLVKAYVEVGQPERAIALCRRLANSSPPQVQAWAQQTLPLLSTPPTTAPSGRDISSPPPTAESTSPSSLHSSPATGHDGSQPLSPEEATQLYVAGNKALKMGRFAEAVEALEVYCRKADPTTRDYPQAQMWLAKAYQGNGQTEMAIALCEYLATSNKEFVKIWATRYLQGLGATTTGSDAQAHSEAQANSPAAPTPEPTTNPATSGAPSPQAWAFAKAGRSPRRGVNLTMKGVAASLAWASGITIVSLFGMIMVLCLSLLLIKGSSTPTAGLILAAFIAIAISLGVFFLSPFIMDLIQAWLYDTRWVSLTEIERYSPEAARTVRLICQQKKLKQPRLGIIQDLNPTAFTYGSLPDSARLVVSQGLFHYLDDDEIATVYAHELGHIVHWDFAVMTLASTLVQITYLLYTYIDEVAAHLGNGENSRRIKNGARAAAIAAYVFYIVGEYLLLYLSRTREYYADHFAAEITGNPNGLSRALIKIAYGVLEEGQRHPEPSKLLQGTRALGIADPRGSTLSGTAYRIASDPTQVGRVFLWDMFNPWAWWMELSSTHPLTGKRVRALTTYAEQLGLPAEFDMAAVIREGRTLNKKRLYGNFTLDIVLFLADWLGLGLGIALGAAIVFWGGVNPLIAVSLALIGFGAGTLLKAIAMYPDFHRAPEVDVLALMSDPYASPLRGRAVKLAGTIIGRGDAGNKLGCDFKLQDRAGMIFLRYSSRFGPLGNLIFGWTQADGFINRSVHAVGWFRRGTMPWVDLVRMDCPEKWTVHSYHRFWTFVMAIGAIVLGFILPVFTLPPV